MSETSGTACGRRWSEAGETLLTLVVSVGLATVVFAATVSSFLDAARHGFDQEIRLRALEEAGAVLDLMAFDLRMLGSGMPLGQPDFRIDDATLQPASYPLLPESNATSIAFRMNEWGTTTLLTADFNPAATSLVNVFSSTGFQAGNTVYINNATTGGTAGFAGTISSIAGNQLTVGLGNTYTAGTVFRSGSLIDRVSTIIYASPGAAGGGITRDAGNGPVLLSPDSSFSATYLDVDGIVMALPLSADTIAHNLGAIRLSIQVRGDHALRDGSIFTAQAGQTIGIRNLNVSR